MTNWTIDGVKEALAAKKVSARELASDFYKRIGERNTELNAYLTLSEGRAYAQAERMDALVAAGKPLPPLAGVPIAIKDVISTRGVRTTCGSKILENYVPPYDATAVERLEAAGAVILGKTNCDEFAMGSSNENSAYGASETRKRRTACQGVRAAARRQRWRLAWPWRLWEPTRADRSASRGPSAGYPR